MFTKEAIQFIIKEVTLDKGRLNEYVINNVENKIHCVELALKISENLERLANLKNSIAEQINEIAIDPNKLNMERFQKVAQFLEIFLYLKDPQYYKAINGYTGTLSNETVKEAKKNGQMLNSLSIPEALNKLGLLTSENYNRLRQNYKNPFEYQNFSKEMKLYASVYYLRNEVSHADRDLSLTQKWEYFKEILIIYLEVAGHFRKELEKELNHINLSSKTNADAYMKKIIKEYENRSSFEYIILEGKEKTKNNGEATSLIKIIQNNNNCRIKLIGNAGMGKTSTLLYLAYNDAKNYNGHVPIYVSLKDVDLDNSILAIMCDKQHLDCKINILEDLLTNGYINVYFDGINEIKNENIRQNVVNQINEFIVKYEKIRIVLTDRENNSITVTEHVKPYIIEKLTDEKIKQFIEKNTSEKELINLIIELVFKDDELKELVRIPYRLYKLIEIVIMDGPIPKNNLEFDQYFTNAIIEREVKEKGIAEARNLTYFLKTIILNKKEIYERDELVDIISLAIKEKNLSDENSDKVIDLLAQLGILKEISFNKYIFANNEIRNITREEKEVEDISW